MKKYYKKIKEYYDNAVCADCKYSPENLVFADTCNKGLEIREANKDNKCPDYKPHYLKIFKDWVNRL